MSNIHTFTEHVKVDVAMAYATLNNSSNAPTYLSMKNYDLIAFAVHTGTLASSASINATIYQTDGTTPKTASISKTAYTTDDGVFILEARASQLDVANGYYAFGILITETASQNAVVGSIAYRLRARYPQATLSS